MHDLATLKRMNSRKGAKKIHDLARATNLGGKTTAKRVDKSKS